MQWIETIELRTSNGKPISISELKALLSAYHEPCASCRVLLYEHNSVKSDIAIQLVFTDTAIFQHGSPLGLWLKEMLRDMGMVSHKIWIEKAKYRISGNEMETDPQAIDNKNL